MTFSRDMNCTANDIGEAVFAGLVSNAIIMWRATDMSFRVQRPGIEPTAEQLEEWMKTSVAVVLASLSPNNPFHAKLCEWRDKVALPGARAGRAPTLRLVRMKSDPG